MKKPDVSELVMDLESDYYLKVENQLLGPVSWLEIVHLYDLQTINQNDFYSCSENGPWVRFFESNFRNNVRDIFSPTNIKLKSYYLKIHKQSIVLKFMLNLIKQISFS